ncbi:FAD:protein FMN transferase [Simkania negevensis]|uniref:FAD:protein FMN transferase n=1 Tax=Simkania negevensis TaxID=83561 RepID=A0ABS3AQ78_9BACT|nr:FAD:protein FMN transferase [Simkania negevensis]
MLSGGGEIRTQGSHPSGRRWRVSIRDARSEADNEGIATLEMDNQAIATSGDYLQNWSVKDDDATVHTYSHIINPKTLIPLKVEADRITSVTVVAPTCAMADGLATALMLFNNAAEAKKWAEALQAKDPRLSFWIATH